MTLSAIVMSGASATVLAWSVAVPGLRLDVSPAAWLWLILIALVSTVLAMVTFLAGLRLTGPSKAAILSTFEPVVTALLAALVLAETLRPSQVVGGAVVLTSVVVLQGYPRVRSVDAWSVRRRAPAERTPPGTPTAPAAELDA